MALPSCDFAIGGVDVTNNHHGVRYWDVQEKNARVALLDGSLTYGAHSVLGFVRSLSRKKNVRQLFRQPGDTHEVTNSNLHFFVSTSQTGRWVLCANVFGGPYIRDTYRISVLAIEKTNTLGVRYAGRDGAQNYFEVGTISDLMPPRKKRAAEEDDVCVTGERSFEEVEADKRREAERNGDLLVVE